MSTNITYVSFLIKTTSVLYDVEKRLEWVKPLLALDIDLIFFVDSFYRERLPPVGPRTRVIALEFNELRTAQRILAAGELALPPQRTPEKDTLEYMCLINSKPEIPVLAKHFVKTPYIAFIDAGLPKIFKNLANLKRLETLQMKGNPLVWIPGCHRPQRRNAYPDLWSPVCWMYSGGFFVVPTTRVDELDAHHIIKLDEFLAKKAITWEVNIWAAWMPYQPDGQVIWYEGIHDDGMVTNLPMSAD